MSEKQDQVEDKSLPMHSRMINFLRDLQDRIIEQVTKIDGGEKELKVDEWKRGEHYGRIMVLQDSKVFEKAGVTMSVVKDKLSEARRLQLNQRGWDIQKGEHPYLATGLSLVFHPVNPMAPTVHLNYRYFEVSDENNPDGEPMVWWFGGGTDLTPIYYFGEDAINFHKILKEALEPHGKQYYPKFKKWCDEYFYIPHRQEHRGIGGIFFDDLTSKKYNEKEGVEGGSEAVFSLVKDCANSFIKSYFPILETRKDMEYTEKNKEWQQIRRGRYVEFNLVYDRGTHFGLKVPGIRAENILVSLPLTARWEFDHVPEKDSLEEETFYVLKRPHDWLNLAKKD